MRTIKSILVVLAMLVSVASFAGPIDINSADASTLASAIIGVGESKAIAIVEYRDAHGPFASVDDLSNVKGIGMKTVDKSRRNLMVSAPPGK
ncbi:MAG: helix-hairpin-helix domain-containing protein [Gammaproteobacteria bacterium]|nr:helix-hairpin-helix domain-containing protein [Gammaproteobacteria bacterium]